MWNEFTEWLRDHPLVVFWGSVASVVMFVGTLVVVPIIVARMRADYFVRHVPRHRAPHPALNAVGLVAKNLAGVVFLIMGVAMLFIPGQGLLTILMGLALMDFPGKHAAQLWLVRYPPLQRSINWMRRKADKPPLELPD